MSIKHAPAPWTIDTHKVSNSNGQKDYVIIRILDAEGRLVTEMTDLSRTEQNMANAKIISQAPDLVFKLRVLTKLIQNSTLTDAHRIDKCLIFLKEYA